MTLRMQFRAWNAIENKIEYYTLNDLCYNSNRPDICLEKWQQFTGINDKNGKKIFEGDIYALHQGVKPTPKSTYFIGLVIKQEDTWLGFSDKQLCSERERSYGYSPFSNRKKCTVIGNTIENPELLTESKIINFFKRKV